MQTIQSIGVLSVAKINAAIYGVMGILFMPFLLLISLAGAFAGPRHNPLAGAVGVVFALVMPVFYAGVGFVTGLLGSLIYNLFAKWLGGIEIELSPPPSAPIVTSSTLG